MRLFEKNRHRWVAIAPRGPCKAGGEAERAPRFEIFLEATTVDTLNLNSQPQTTQYKKLTMKCCTYVPKLRRKASRQETERASCLGFVVQGLRCAQMKFEFTNSKNGVQTSGSKVLAASRQSAQGVRAFQQKIEERA